MNSEKLKINPCCESKPINFFNCDLTIFYNVYYLISSHGEYLCYSPNNKIYYLSDNRNSDSVFIFSPQNELETIRLYQTITGIFLTTILDKIDVQDL